MGLSNKDTTLNNRQSKVKQPTKSERKKRTCSDREISTLTLMDPFRKDYYRIYSFPMILRGPEIHLWGTSSRNPPWTLKSTDTQVCM